MASEKNKTNSYKRKKDGSPIKTIPQNQAEQSYCNETTANTPTKQSQQGILSGKKWSECKKTDKIMTIATIFIAAFTLILLTIIYFQYSAFVDAAHVENRAYLVLACEIDTPIIGKPPHARWEVKNIGKKLLLIKSGIQMFLVWQVSIRIFGYPPLIGKPPILVISLEMLPLKMMFGRLANQLQGLCFY